MTAETKNRGGKHARPLGAAGVVSRVCNVLFVALLVIVIAAVGGMLAAQGLGFKPMAILSGSMEPNYNVNGLVFIDTNVQAADIGTGDVIAFEMGDETTVTHRVVDVDRGAREFTTKGDANDTEDGPVGFDALIGRATLHLPHLGGAAMGLQTKKGMGVGLIVLAVLVILYVVPILLAPPKDEKGERKRDRTAISAAE